MMLITFSREVVYIKNQILFNIFNLSRLWLIQLKKSIVAIEAMITL